jgi:hypothetical protein
MKLGGVKTHINLRNFLRHFVWKSEKYKTIFCWILLWKLSKMIENCLTKKINPNTNIFNSVINAVQTFKELFTWRHIKASNFACKIRRNNILLRALQLQLHSKQWGSLPFSLIIKLNKKVIFSFLVKYDIYFQSWYNATYFHSPPRLVKICGIISCWVKKYPIFHWNEKLSS